jgi:threonine synthase
MTVAVSRARELGAARLFAPSAGNAGLALAAYGARAGLPVAVYLPERAETAVAEAIARYGAEVVRVGATIREAGEEARRREAKRAFELSTLREPYRVEGKKTMGFEIRERFGADRMPDAIVYPTGGGTGLVGMWKGFQELRSLGLLEKVPRLVAVQSETCAPVVRALRDGSVRVTPWTDATTVAPGLLVPAPFSSERVLEAVRATRGVGVTVSDEGILAAQAELARRFGLSVAREAAATWASLPELAGSGAVRSGERVLLYLTGRAAS